MLTEFRLEMDAEVGLHVLTVVLDAVAGVSSNPQSISNRLISFIYTALRDELKYRSLHCSRFL